MKLKFGMVGGGNGAFIGNVAQHTVLSWMIWQCSRQGCFTRNMKKNLETARTWGVSDESRVYADYREMAEREFSGRWN